VNMLRHATDPFYICDSISAIVFGHNQVLWG